MPITTGHGRNQVLTLDNSAGSPTAIQTYCRKITLHESEDTADTTAIGDKRAHNKDTIGDSALDIDGLWHPTADAIMDAWLTISRSMAYSPFGVSTGRLLKTGEMVGSSYEIEIDFESEVTFSASGEGTGVITSGTN